MLTKKLILRPTLGLMPIRCWQPLKRSIKIWPISLKNAEAQVEDQRKLLYTVELNLATEKQKVLDLKAELQKLKDVAQVAREATKATANASYKHGVVDTKTRLSEKVVVVCRDYCTESWGVAMDRAGVPIDSELRRAENIFFSEDIWEIPDTIPSIEQLPTTQTPLADVEVSKGAGVGEEAQLPM